MQSEEEINRDEGDERDKNKFLNLFLIILVYPLHPC